MLHEYHATMAMQEHHRRVGDVTQRAHLHPDVRRPSWWSRLRRRREDALPVVPSTPTPVALPGVRRLTVARMHPAFGFARARAAERRPG